MSWLVSQAKSFQFHRFQYQHVDTEYDRRCGMGSGWDGNEAMARMVKTWYKQIITSPSQNDSLTYVSLLDLCASQNVPS